MNLIYKCKEDLQKLVNTKSKIERTKLIKKIDNCVIKAISEISYNCLRGNLPLSKCKFKSLKQHKNILRKLASKKLSFGKKKQIISQKGGFINILLPAALTLLSSILERKLGE